MTFIPTRNEYVLLDVLYRHPATPPLQLTFREVAQAVARTREKWYPWEIYAIAIRLHVKGLLILLDNAPSLEQYRICATRKGEQWHDKEMRL